MTAISTYGKPFVPIPHISPHDRIDIEQINHMIAAINYIMPLIEDIKEDQRMRTEYPAVEEAHKKYEFVKGLCNETSNNTTSI